MKLFRSAPARHLAAMLLAFVMLASVCSFPVFADSDEDYEAAYAEYAQILQEISDIWSLSDEEQSAAYAALRQKYPTRPDVAYEVVSHTDYNSPNDKLAAYDQVIQLAKRFSGGYLYGYNLTDEIIQACYEAKANIYLKELYQQENYIASMRSALDAEDKANRTWFDAGINAASAVEGLQEVQAKRAELDAIERWYKPGNPVSFTAWNGRVQVTIDAVNRAAHIQMQTPNGKDSDWIELPSGESVEKINMEYSSVSQDISCNAPYAQSFSKVLRAIDGVYFVIPVQWELYEQNPDASYATYSMTYHKNDGTTQTKNNSWSFSTETIGFARDFFNMRDLSLPADIRRYMETECSEEWNAGGLEDSGRIYYGAHTIAL